MEVRNGFIVVRSAASTADSPPESVTLGAHRRSRNGNDRLKLRIFTEFSPGRRHKTEAAHPVAAAGPVGTAKPTQTTAPLAREHEQQGRQFKVAPAPTSPYWQSRDKSFRTKLCCQVVQGHPIRNGRQRRQTFSAVIGRK